MRTFLLVWLGQVTSLIGSQLTAFGLGVWVYTRTGSTTLYGLIVLATLGPHIVAAPFLGVMVDRSDLRRALLAAHAGAGACSLCLAVLLGMSALSVPFIAIAVAIASIFSALEFPALSAAISILVPGQAGRASGFLQLGAAIGQIIAPFGAGLLLPRIGLSGILAIDVCSFLFAMTILALVRFPVPEAREASARRGRPLLEDMASGFSFLRERRALAALLLFFFAVNWNLGVVQVLITPFVLSFADTRVLGGVLSIGGMGMLLGSVVMAAFGAPRRPVTWMLGFTLLQGFFLLFAALPPSALLVGASAFGVLFPLPLISGCTQTIWQHRVPIELQGRVFSLRSMVAKGSLPLAYLLSGPLADRVFEPAMARRGLLSASAGRILGDGPGRGIALLFAALGLATILLALLGFAHRGLRALEAQEDGANVKLDPEGNTMPKRSERIST